MDSLVVDLNRDGPHSIDVATSAFHADEPFEIILDNHGAALHVYVQLDDDLAGAMSLSAGNHFVKEGRIRRVQVDVDATKAPVRGRLKVVTGYGAQTEYVTVSVEEREEAKRQVDVDESLGKPKPRPRPEPEERNRLLDPQGIPVVALGVLAVAVALLAALALGGELPLVAALIVLVGAGVGAVLLRG